MYPIKATAIILAIVLSSSAARLPYPRDSAISVSYASLAKPIISPYYVYFGNPQTQKLEDAYDSLGLRAATVGFISSPQGQCQIDKDLDGLITDVKAFVAKGGAVSLSFGGNLQDTSIEARAHVQQACTDTNSLTQLIESAMDQFNTHNIEFDIEDDGLLEDTQAATRLAQSLVQIKSTIPDTFVTYTVGVVATGMPDPQQAWVQAAKDNSLQIDVLNLMTMNFNAAGGNVQNTQTAMTAGASQLASIYSISSTDAMKKMGMLPAIGVDNNGQIIDINDMITLGQFVQIQGMNTITYWNFNRDFPGGVGDSQQSLTNSSAPNQTESSQFLTTLLSNIIPTFGQVPLQPGSLIEIQPAAPQTSNEQPGQKASLPPPDAAFAPQGVSVVSA